MMLSRVLLIDATQLLYRSAFAQGRALGLKDPVYGPGTVAGVVGMVRQAAYRFAPLSVILVWDGGRSARRKALLPEYKAGRQVLTEAQTRMRWFDTGRLIQLLRRLGCRSALLPGKEADDVIGLLAGRCIAPTIVSSDQDFLQLVQRGASCWFHDKDKFVSGVNFFEEYGVLPNQYLLYRAIVGDPGDAIPGVRGVGPKTVLPLLGRGSKIETFDDLRRATAGETLSTRERAIFASRDTVLKNFDLMDLLRETFTQEEIKSIDDTLGSTVVFDDLCFNEMESLGMKIVIEIWSEWSQPFRRLI